MNTHSERTQENKSQSVSASSPQIQSGSESTIQFVDNQPEAIAQRKIQEMANNSSQVSHLKAFQKMADNSPQAKQATQLQAMANYSPQQQQPIQKKLNKTGLPDNLKTGMENLSGMSLGDVKVHRNSNKPAQLHAHAYAQGTDIHLASGQEKHLPHEVWHVVQQKQGRVQPTLQMKGEVHVNDDAGLEKEANVFGAKALQFVGDRFDASVQQKQQKLANNKSNSSGVNTFQLILDDTFTGVDSVEKITDDVWAVKYRGGDIIIKFKGDLAADVIADKTLKDLGANAPDSKLVAAETLYIGLNDKWLAPSLWKVLRDRLKTLGTVPVLVADKLKGAALGTTPTDKTDALSKEVVASTEFATALGKVAAFDLLLGHQDRVILGSLNLGNMMTLPGNNFTLQQIDNQIAENDTGLLVAGLTNVAAALKNGTTSIYSAKVHKSLNLVMSGDPTVDCGFKVRDFDFTLIRFVDTLAKNLDELKTSLTDIDQDKGTGAKAILKRNIARFETARKAAQAELRL